MTSEGNAEGSGALRCDDFGLFDGFSLKTDRNVLLSRYLFAVVMIFLVSVNYARGSEYLDSRSTFSEGEIVVRRACEEEIVILTL